MQTAYYFSAILVGFGLSLPFSPLPVERALINRLCLLAMALLGFVIGRWR